MISALLYVIGVLLGAFAAYQFVLMLASLPWLCKRSKYPPFGAPSTRFLVVIPAHNEGALVGNTVRSLLASDYPRDMLNVVVIADNCSDDTAEHARRAKAECLERIDSALRGKPYALHWFFERYDLSPFTGIAIVDADTMVDTQFLRAMDRHLQHGEAAVQGFYGVMNPDETWLTRLAMVPANLKFYLNFPGKQALGLSCPLAGNGMCFKADILRHFGWSAFTLSEDWEYYLILATEGYKVTSAPDAIIYGQVATSLRLGKAQRQRWSKGRIDALRLHWKALLRKALRDRAIYPLDAIFDVARPSHSVLLSLTCAHFFVAAGFWLAGAASPGPTILASVVVLIQLIYFLTAFAIEQPPLRTWLALAVVPWYLLWKCMITVTALIGSRERNWVKTTRN